MKKDFPFGKIAAEELKYRTEFASLTLNDSLVAYFVASLDISLCKEMITTNWEAVLDTARSCSPQNSHWLGSKVTITIPRCLGTSEGGF